MYQVTQELIWRTDIVMSKSYEAQIAVPSGLQDKPVTVSFSIKGSGTLANISTNTGTFKTLDYQLNSQFYQRVEWSIDSTKGLSAFKLGITNADKVDIALPKLEYGNTSTPYTK